MLSVLSKSPHATRFADYHPIRLIPAAESLTEPRRRKLWELSQSLHCSIIGTCLGATELRRLVAKAMCEPFEQKSDHDIHKLGVTLASNQRNGAKILHKALDARYASVIRSFDKATCPDDVRRLWNEARARGEIPGAYWASLTHPTANEQLVRDIFGDVHMLSHLVGAANRADIRRLAEIEAENARLVDKAQRQQEQLRIAVSTRDQEIERLRRLLAERLADESDDESRGARAPDETNSLEQLVARLQKQLDKETAHRQRSERERERLRAEHVRLAEDIRRLEGREKQLSAELSALEAHVAPSARDLGEVGETNSLAGATLLYVGGREGNMQQLRAAAEKRGARFEHHDGGQQEASSLLPGLVARADIVVFPVEFISHEAALAVKRLCKQAFKPYVPLPGAGLGCFLNAMNDARVKISEPIL